MLSSIKFHDSSSFKNVLHHGIFAFFVVPPAIDEANLVDNPKIIVNRTIVLECPVEGVPLPTVHWMKNDEPIEHFTSDHPNDVRFQSGGRDLEIKNTQVTDSGKYTCLAKNPAGVLRRDFHLDVLGAS